MHENAEATSQPSGADRAAQPSRSIVGCILTRNEERNIERAISSLAGAVDHVVIVDSESTDRTVELATNLGATVLVHRFEGFSAQRNWAMGQIEQIFGPVWVFSLDADEWLSEALAHELHDARDRLEEATVWLVPLRRYFAGRLLRHGGFQRTWLARLVRVGSARYEPRDVNEHLAIDADERTGRLTGWLEHDDVASWEQYIDKHNSYSTLEALARIDARGERQVSLATALRHPNLRRRFLRHRVFDHLPARPALRFVQIYVFSAGFLDGRAGFYRALFEAWQEMCTDLKAAHLRTGVSPP